VGDEVVFPPSGKRSTIASVEGFNEPHRERIGTHQATGVTLSTQTYIRSGELMCRAEEPPPAVGMVFKASVFWLGKWPLIKGKRYKLKIHTSSTSAHLREVRSVIDAADLGRESGRDHVERHEVAECVLETMRPIAFDVESSETGRFVIVDDYEIAGGGIITEDLAQEPELFDHAAVGRKAGWVLGNIGEAERRTRYLQQPKLVLVTGIEEAELNDMGARLERRLFEDGRFVYFLGMANLVGGLGADARFGQLGRDEHLRRLGELARLFADAGCGLWPQRTQGFAAQGGRTCERVARAGPAPGLRETVSPTTLRRTTPAGRFRAGAGRAATPAFARRTLRSSGCPSQDGAPGVAGGERLRYLTQSFEACVALWAGAR
jgi:bifunctional enzyme CysN/CysC